MFPVHGPDPIFFKKNSSLTNEWQGMLYVLLVVLGSTIKPTTVLSINIDILYSWSGNWNRINSRFLTIAVPDF